MTDYYVIKMFETDDLGKTPAEWTTGQCENVVREMNDALLAAFAKQYPWLHHIGRGECVAAAHVDHPEIDDEWVNGVIAYIHHAYVEGDYDPAN